MKKLTLLLIIVFSVLAINIPVSASAPYQTWTLGPGGFYYPVQDAYTPVGEIALPISEAEDMFLAPDGFLYIADTGNSRIVKIDDNFEIIAEFGVDILDEPTGLFVDEDSTLYIADAGTNTVFIIDSDDNLVNEFGRPTEPLFGANNQFLPRKISVDVRKNLYIVSEGSVNGLVMLNIHGDFIGYFGANSAQMSIKMILQRAFLTEEQLQQFIRNEAPSPTNVALDERSLVYTITSGARRGESIRKFNISGANLFDDWIVGSTGFRDIDVSNDGLLVTIDGDGHVFEYDHNGTLIFVFGALERGDQRLGLLSNPTAIERVGDDLYVLDKSKNAIVVYEVTDFARQLHEGVALYTEGYYEEARPYFEEVLNDNGLVLMAYQALADAAYKELDYDTALSYYRLADDRNGYSEAFWELRNAVLQDYLGTALIVIVIIWIAWSIFSRLEKRYHWLDPLRKWGNSLKKFQLIDDFVFMFRFIKKPADSFYYIKHDQRGSLPFAFIIYAWVVILRIVSLYFTGFVFSPYYSTSWQVRIETEIMYTIVPLILWNVASHLIASINDGEGHARHVIIGSAYSLFPVVLMWLPITLVSNLLTVNEVFLYSFTAQLMWLWTGIMLFIMVKEIQNYEFGETVRSILTTLFTMAIFLLTAYILYVLFNQLYEFVQAIIQEAGLRV